MKLVSAKIKGLKGIYSKSGQKEIFIDFKKCIHDIVYIIGKNGSGKSTLMTVLHPFPDSPQMYLDNEPGEKELIYLHDDIGYKITIQYPLTNNGTRATTKAYIKECKQGQLPVELNSNGTIGSFKDALSAVFCLDPNFISLSHLSVEDRGIVDKKPAERKKFVANILESIEVYNNINKTLVKRSGVFKSMLNSIVAKIDSIGDESKLLMDESAAKLRLNTLQQQKSDLEKQITAAQTTISIIDPEGKLENNYTNLVSRLNTIKSHYAACVSTDTMSLEDAIKASSNIDTQIAVLNKEHENLSNRRVELKDNIDAIGKKLFIKRQKLESFQDTQSLKDMETIIEEMTKKASACVAIMKKMNVAPDSITKDEYITALGILMKFRDAVVNIRSYATEWQINYALRSLESNSSIQKDMSNLLDLIDKTNREINDLKSSLSEYTRLQKETEVLKFRPNECTISDCVFIKQALDAQELEPLKHIGIISDDLDQLQRSVKKHRDNYDELANALRVYNQIDTVLSMIVTNNTIISKLPNGKNFTDKIILLEKIANNDQFNDITDLYSHVDQANVLDEYNHYKSTLIKLKLDYNSKKAQAESLQSLEEEIAELEKETYTISKAMTDIDRETDAKLKDVGKLNKRKDELEDLIISLRKRKDYYDEIVDLQSQIRVVSDNVEKIAAEVKKVNQLNSQLISINNEIGPLEQLCNTLSFSLSKLFEYKKDLSEYNDKYQLVELIKKYSSPTKGGIQTVFMQLYMDKTLSMSNQLLQLMFDGDLELLPYVINENEFRIPVKNNITNLVTDDISNCSTSEKSMVAMIMSFVLAFQGSTMYNIIRLDEIDGGLDQSNRAMFPDILRNIMGMLNIEQCLIISHSSESDLSDVDIISLTPVSHETLKGNVIFQL